jgi:hypothetical protein
MGKGEVEVGNFVPFAKPLPTFKGLEVYKGMSIQSLEHPFEPIEYDYICGSPF